MRSFAIIGIVSLALFIYFSFSSGSRRSGLKEKSAVICITLISCILSILLLYWPELPGPSDWIMPLFKPAAKLLGLE